MFKLFFISENIEINDEHIFAEIDCEIIKLTPSEVLDKADEISTYDFVIENNFDHKKISEIVVNYLSKI